MAPDWIMERLLRLSCSFLNLLRSVGGGGLTGGGGRAGAARVGVGVRLFLGAGTGVLPGCCPCCPCCCLALAALGEGMGLTPADPGGRGAILFFLRAGRTTLGEAEGVL